MLAALTCGGVERVYAPIGFLKAFRYTSFWSEGSA